MAYDCFFEFGYSGDRPMVHSVRHDRMDWFTEGFWVDGDVELALDSLEVRYWIPPSAIKHIEKVKKDR